MTHVALASKALVARTAIEPAPSGDLLDAWRPDGLAWLRDGAGFVTAGVAAVVAATDVDRVLATIERHDAVELPGTGPIAVGSLPFADTTTGTLVVPRHVWGIAADGTRWRTDIAAPGAQAAGAGPARPPAPPGPAGPPGSPTIALTTSRERWYAMVSAALEQVRNGELAKVVLARTLDLAFDHPVDPIWLLRRLAAREPHRYLFATAGMVGASPELLVERAGTSVRTCPLAGSSASPAPADVAALARSPKDRREHEFVAGAVAEVLAAHCVDVRVGATEPIGLADLAHLATPMQATAHAATPSALGLALALHPTPAVAGTPGPAAVRFIGEHEPDRGHYAGPVGWVDAHGDGQFALALRCAEISATNRRRARLHAGAGIVAGSRADAEWDEIDAKLSAVLTALDGP